jgi:hypothetical protein
MSRHMIFFWAAALTVVGGLAACRDGSQRVAGDLTQEENDDRVGQEIRRCAVPEVGVEQVDQVNALLRAARMNGRQRRSAASATVRLVFHVISSGSGEAEGNVSEAQLAAQVQVLNAAYAGAAGGAATPFHFELAGVSRTVNPLWASMTFGSDAELQAKSALHQGDQSVLNVYLVSPPDGTLGWATFPFDYTSAPLLDGVVVWYQTLPGGPLIPYNEGDTLTHEVGHWLGLFHTFQGECSAVNDTIADTPAEQWPAFGCPVARDSCLRDSGADAIHNYMDYSDDSCLFEFTAEQSERMDLLASGLRGL